MHNAIADATGLGFDAAQMLTKKSAIPYCIVHLPLEGTPAPNEWRVAA